jgi:hypothetical protein
MFMLLKRIVRVLSTSAAVLANTAVAFASPFNPNDIDPDSAMLLHVDCDAIRASSIGQWLLSEPAMQDKLASLGARFDLDLRNQLHGITFYMTAPQSNDWVMVIAADFEPGPLLEKAQALHDFLAATNGSHVIYSWLDESSKRSLARNARVFGAISGHHIVCSHTELRLAHALDLLEDTKRSAEARRAPLPTMPGQRILLESMILKAGFSKAQGPVAFLQMCKSVYLKVSEANHTTTAALHFEADDDGTATQINSIFYGFLGMLKLKAEDANAAKFANSIKITKDGLEVGVTISLPSSEMIDIMKAGQEKGKRRGLNRRARDQESQPNNK